MPRRSNETGFTLIELLIVMVMIAILLSVAVPNYQRAIRGSREALLRQNLATMRSLIQEFSLDKKRAPSTLDELVTEGYIDRIPNDITNSPTTWREEVCDLQLSPEQSTTGICDVHSGSDEAGTDGVPYSDW